MSRTRSPLIGCWRITESDQWDRNFLDLGGPAYLDLDERGTGNISFGAIAANIDYRTGTRDGSPAIEFSWEGYDEDMQVLGRGWALLDSNGVLQVRLFVHLGDEAGLTAVPMLRRPDPQQKPMRSRPLARKKRRRR